MLRGYVFALVLVLGVFVSERLAAPAEDEVIDLPGLPSPPTFKQYAGYLDANPGRHFFYWFTEAKDIDPATAPTVFWFNGGPGCSSINGMLTENGPFWVNLDGATLKYNDYGWNKLANVVFLESPAGVGFSYADDQSLIPTNDDETAFNNYAAILSFFAKFPEYLANQLFITGESYCGQYIPTLSYVILNQTNNLNFQGFAIGNGLHEWQSNFNTEILYYASHGLIDQALKDRLFQYCCTDTTPTVCDFYNANDPDCISALLETSLTVDLSGVNPYGIFDYCARVVGDAPRNEHQPMSPRFRPLSKGFSEEQKMKIQNLRSDPPCSNSDYLRQWINQPSVRAALHVPDTVIQWTTCSDLVSATYESQYDTMLPQYNFLLSKTRALLYSGDADTVCNYLGGEYFAEKLDRNVIIDYNPWVFEGQTAGFFKVYENVTFLTVLGAGHMVPTDRPPQALTMLNNFIYNLPFY
ncbi:hypothetical protein CHUAL_008608 [Chamberlinius hualienensis]